MGELLPILKFIESNNLPIQVMCSSRDILEPKSIAKPLIGDFGVKIINDYYSRVLVHGDKNFIDLGETFTQLKRIEVPISYTGYVSDEKYVPKINRENFNEIVLSAGGGKVAQPFIIKMVNSFKKFGSSTSASVKLRTAINPFLRNKSTSGCSLSNPLGADFSSSPSNFPPKYFL